MGAVTSPDFSLSKRALGSDGVLQNLVKTNYEIDRLSALHDPHHAHAARTLIEAFILFSRSAREFDVANTLTGSDSKRLVVSAATTCVRGARLIAETLNAKSLGAIDLTALARENDPEPATHVQAFIKGSSQQLPYYQLFYHFERQLAFMKKNPTSPATKFLEVAWTNFLEGTFRTDGEHGRFANAVAARLADTLVPSPIKASEQDSDLVEAIGDALPRLPADDGLSISAQRPEPSESLFPVPHAGLIASLREKGWVSGGPAVAQRPFTRFLQACADQAVNLNPKGALNQLSIRLRQFPRQYGQLAQFHL